MAGQLLCACMGIYIPGNACSASAPYDLDDEPPLYGQRERNGNQNELKKVTNRRWILTKNNLLSDYNLKKESKGGF